MVLSPYVANFRSRAGVSCVPSIDARGMPMRSAKKRSVPATAPQLPHTLVLPTRADSPHAVCSSTTRSNGITCAISSEKRARVASVAFASFVGSGALSERYTLAIASAASSSDFTSTPFTSAHSAISS